MAQCLLITGMHRSGTSAVAGALDALGVDFGDRLMPPREGENSRGYFEDLEIHKAHDRLLSDAGHSWDDPRALDESHLPERSLGDFREEIRRILRDRFSTKTLWAIKDPRICLLGATWLEVLDDLGIETRWVIVHRHPNEVAASLAHRNGFSAEKSAALWLNHNLAIESSTRGVPRAFITYDELLDSPGDNLTRLAHELDLSWPLAPDQADAHVRDFLAPALRNHTAHPEEKVRAGRFSPWPERLHLLLLTASRARSTPLSDPVDNLVRGMPPFEDLVDPFPLEHNAQRANFLEGELASLRDQLVSLSDQLVSLSDMTEDRLNAAESVLGTDAQEKRDTAAAITGLQEQLDEQSKWLRIQEDEIETHKGAIKALQEQLGERTRWLQIQSEAIDRLLGELEQLKKASEC